MTADPQKHQSHSKLTKAIADNKKSIAHNIKYAAEIIKNITIIWSLTSILLGAFFVGSYLKEFSVPFTPLDNTLIVVLQIFAFTFVVLSAFIVVYVVLPVTLRFVVSYKTAEAFPRLFTHRKRCGTTDDTNASDDTNARFGFQYFLFDYTMFYFPLISVQLLLIYSVIFSFNSSLADVVLVISFLGGFGFVVCAVEAESVFSALLSDAANSFLMANSCTLVWAGIIGALSERLMESKLGQVENGNLQKVVVCAIIVVTSILHITLSRVDDDKAKRLPLAVCFVVLAGGCVWPGPAYIGGVILRIAGLGGGTVISYQVEKGSPAKGCLIWPSSNYLIIMDRLDTGSCLRSPSYQLNEAQGVNPPVHMFRRETVQIIYEKLPP